MPANEVASALMRAQAVYERRPGSALHADSPAVAHWQEGLRVVTKHPSGRSVVSDMPTEFGGSGDEVTPGWYARAGFAACTATCIAIAAQLRGIALTRVEVTVESRSDSRGALGMKGPDGSLIDAAPGGFRIRIALAGAADDAALEALARDGCRFSPIACSLARANDVELDIEVLR
jgi:uncharacterized OsmC-like protein